MRSRHLAIGLSALALAFTAGTASAGDTIRLSLPNGTSAPTLNLKATPDDLAADTVATRFGRGGFVGYHGFRGGFGGGFHGGFRGGFVGFRGFHGGFRGGFVGFRGFRGFHSGFRGGFVGFGGFQGGFYGPSFFGSSFSTPCFSPTWGYAPIGTFPIAETGVSVTAQTTAFRPAAPANYERPLPMPYADDEPRPAPNPSGTYPYDGGPQRQIPMPPSDEIPVSYPNRDKPAIVEDLAVKQPGKSSGKWTYPAYGEKPSR